MPLALHHLTEDFLEVWMLESVDDGVEHAVEDDDHASPGNGRVTGWDGQGYGKGSQAGNKGTHHDEEVLGNLHLSPVDAACCAAAPLSQLLGAVGQTRP